MTKSTSTTAPLEYCFNANNKYEICLDEVGRGPLFGRLYVAAVILPPSAAGAEGAFNVTGIKDSKKFSSKKKIREVADYIKQHAFAWHIHYIENDVIDEINILQSVYRAMHECIGVLIEKIRASVGGGGGTEPFRLDDIMIIVDGDRFKPYCVFDETNGNIMEVSSVTIEQGDAKYVGIAAASIIAKVAHDDYIAELCEQYPLLAERYKLDKNVGYGTKHHIEGIQQYGITQWHRKSYKICKDAAYSPL